MFLPNAGELVSSSEKFMLVESIIKLVLQRDSLKLMEETAIMSVHRKLMDAVISDSCKYVSTTISIILHHITLSYQLYPHSYQKF